MRRSKLLPLLVGALLLVGLGARPAEASSHHYLAMSGSVDIFDDEPWPRDGVWCHDRQIGTSGQARHNSSAATAQPSDRDNTCDGEVRIEFEGRGVLKSDDTLCNVSLTVSLFEGTSTSTTDLDGRWTYTHPTCLAPGSTLDWNGATISNNAEGGDFASFNLRLQHYSYN